MVVGTQAQHNSPENPAVKTLTRLIQEFHVVMIGPVRQEFLSGIQHREQFEWLRGKLHAFSDLPLDVEDFETAAEFYNLCRAKGVQGSTRISCFAPLHTVMTSSCFPLIETSSNITNTSTSNYMCCDGSPVIPFLN